MVTMVVVQAGEQVAQAQEPARAAPQQVLERPRVR